MLIFRYLYWFKIQNYLVKYKKKKILFKHLKKFEKGSFVPPVQI